MLNLAEAGFGRFPSASSSSSASVNETLLRGNGASGGGMTASAGTAPAGAAASPSATAAGANVYLNPGENELRSFSERITTIYQWAFLGLCALGCVKLLVIDRAPPWRPTFCEVRRLLPTGAATEVRRASWLQRWWPLWWLTLMAVHSGLLLFLIHRGRRQRGSAGPFIRALIRLQRLVKVICLASFFVGIQPLFVEYPCAEHAVELGRILWYLQASVLLLPVTVLLLLCLCLPCIVFAFRRWAPRVQNEQPTPNDVVAKLRTLKFADLLTSLRAEFGTVELADAATSGGAAADAVVTAADSIRPLVDAITGVATGDAIIASLANRPAAASDQPAAPGAASGGPPAYTAVPVDPGEADGALSAAPGAGAGADDGPAGAAGPAPSLGDRRIKIDRECPICMTEFNAESEVTLMPCDWRHIFHDDCVKEWLRTSQLCPICRANIVEAVTDGRHADANRAV